MYKYGMRLRGISPGCQPQGVKKFEDVDKRTTGYWSYIYYDEKLTDEQIYRYDLDYLGEE